MGDIMKLGTQYLGLPYDIEHLLESAILFARNPQWIRKAQITAQFLMDGTMEFKSK